jgi:hypothetical protein
MWQVFFMTIGNNAMNRIFTLMLLLLASTNCQAGAVEYGIRARAGIHQTYDYCGGSKKDLVLGLGLGRYRDESQCCERSVSYETPLGPYDRQMTYYGGGIQPAWQNSWRQPLNMQQSAYSQEMGKQSYAYLMPSAYNVHSNLYDGSSRYNPYGINYRPAWY